MAAVVLLGTCDSKLEELLYLREQIRKNAEVRVILIDVGRSNVGNEAIDITQGELVARHGEGGNPSRLPRGEVIKFMAACASKALRELFAQGAFDGIIAAGGSSGTALAAPVMRELPIGFPKMIVSTVASGDTGPIVGETDIAMVYSVVDIAGLNQVLRDILSNAGAAIAAAALAYVARQKHAGSSEGQQAVSGGGKKRVGITMFGVTTPGVDAIRHHLEAHWPIETYVFHATGHGGKAMERLVREGRLDAVLDLTTTELCDLMTGGVMNPGPDRLSAAAEAGIPNIVSLGATDMTNFGPRDTVPEKYRHRLLYEHNPMVTLMRSSEEECRQIGEFLARKLREAKNPDMVQVWIPNGGVSMIATPGGPFEDTKADAVLFDAVREGLNGSGVEIVEDARDVNDETFARDIAEALIVKLGLEERR